MKFLVSLFTVTVVFYCHGQSTTIISGARSLGLANSAACVRNEWSLLNNPGGLASVTQSTAAFTYTRSSFSSFNKMAVVLACPMKFGTAAIGAFRFGDQLYNEQLVSLGFGNSFGLASLGARLNMVQYKAEGFGTRTVVTLGFGGIAKITPKLSVGTLITNVNQPRLSEDDNERMPARIIAGISYKISEKTLVMSEIEKDLDHQSLWRGAAEYTISTKFTVRTGFNVNPSSAFLGFGFRSSRFILDYAYQYSFLIGALHQATVSHPFKKLNRK